MCMNNIEDEVFSLYIFLVEVHDSKGRRTFSWSSILVKLVLIVMVALEKVAVVGDSPR
jgi:hypothetical protein